MLRFRYLDANTLQWVDYQMNHQTVGFRTWCEVENQNDINPIEASQLEITKVNASSRFAEIGLCGTICGPVRRNSDQLIEQLIEVQNFKPIVKPNPVKSEITIEAREGKYNELIIINTEGIIVKAEARENSISIFIVNVSNLPTGVYFVYLKGEGTQSDYAKFVKVE